MRKEKVIELLENALTNTECVDCPHRPKIECRCCNCHVSKMKDALAPLKEPCDKDKAEVYIEIVGGCEGDSISISNESGSGRRVCGPKPWGGGWVKNRWKVKVNRLQKAIEGASSGKA